MPDFPIRLASYAQGWRVYFGFELAGIVEQGPHNKYFLAQVLAPGGLSWLCPSVPSPESPGGLLKFDTIEEATFAVLRNWIQKRSGVHARFDC